MAQNVSEMKPQTRFKFKFQWTDLFWMFGAISLIVGIVGLIPRITEGLAPTNLTSYVPWGVWVGFYDYLVWMEVGTLMLFSVLVYLAGYKSLTKIKPLVLFTGFAVLSMALLIVLLDLGHPERFWHVIVYADFSSMITWMVWLHMSYMLVLVAELYLVFFGGDKAEKPLKYLALLSLPMGLALIIVSGSIFGVVAARPLWNTASIPLMFLISALATGSGLLLLLSVVFWPNKKEADYAQTVRMLARLTAGLLLAGVFAAGVIGLTILYKGNGDTARSEALQLILTGPYWWSFWILHILLGVVVPVMIFLTMSHNPRLVGLGALLTCVTFVVVTLNIVIPTLVTEELKGLSNAFVDPKLSLDYAPNLMEWLILAFVFGVGSLIYGLGMRFLPVLSNHHEEVNS